MARSPTYGDFSDYSDGPFSPVFFFLGDDFKYRTYAYRMLRVKQARSLWNTLTATISGGGRSFHQIYVETSLIQPTLER
jgi:hypothetical protein